MSIAMKKQDRLPASANWLEPVVLFLTILVTDMIYGMPQLISTGFTALQVKDIAVDAMIITVSCVPGWWLHFKLFPFAGWQKRVVLHLITVTVFYSIWVLSYAIYNTLIHYPVMNAIQVLSNLWHNLLFYIQAFSFLHLYHYFRQKEEQSMREKELRRIEYETEIAGLKAQIQPHFLFNTLNSISGSVPAQQEFTRELIARLADIFRYAMMASQEDRVSLKQEVEFIRTYLSLEQHRFGDRLRVVIHMEEGLDNVQVPSMLFQPLVENALKHGIEPSVEGGVIILSLIRQSKKLMIRVSNSGLVQTKDLRQMFHTRGVGLRNTQMRLKKLYDENLEVERTDDCLHFTFHIPFHEKEPARAIQMVASQPTSFNAMSPAFNNNGI